MGIITLFIMWTGKNLMHGEVGEMEKNMGIYEDDN